MNNVSKIWWLNPIWIYLLWIFFTIYCSFIDSKAFYDMYEEPIYVNAYNVFIYILFFISFAFGFYLCKKPVKVLHSVNDFSIVKVRRVFWWLYVIVLVAYIIWFLNLYLTYGSSIILGLVGNLTGYANLFKEDGGKISGITTFTELAIIVAPLNVYLWHLTSKRKYKFTFFLLVFINIIRAAIFAERLAVIEILIPSLVIYAYFGRVFNNKFIKIAPLFGVFVLLIVFGSFEYFRSWEYYREAYDDNMLKFTMDRVFGYYSIAVNTECIQINFLNPNYFPDETLAWLWNLPGLGYVKDYFMPTIHIDYLNRWGNPEFNNPGGLLFAYKDFGFWGLLIQFLFGYFIGRVYKGYCSHGFISSLWYSASYLCILELPRYFFWGSPRAFFGIIAMLVIQGYLIGLPSYGRWYNKTLLS